MNFNLPSALPVRDVHTAASRTTNHAARSRPLRVSWLMIALVMFFSVGRYIPGFEWTLNLIGLASIVVALLMRRACLPSEMRATRNYTWLVVILAPLWGASMGQFVFGQPFWLGLATQRGFLLVLFVLVIVNLVQQGRLKLQDIERALVRLAWINLAICSAVLIFLDPNNFSDVGNLVADGGGVRNQFVLPIPFITFGAFYYFADGTASKSHLSLLKSLPFFFYLAGGGAGTGRILIVAILLSLFIIAGLARRNKRKSFRNIIFTLAMGSLLAIVINFIAPERVSNLFEKYVDAYSVLSGADSVDDWSANARALQAAVVMPWIEKSPLFGTGTISNLWNDGYKGLFEYLHPSDLGFLGIVFVYGLVGFAFFAIQYRLAWRTISEFAIRPRDTSTQAFLLGCCGCLTTLLFTAVTTGSIAFNSEQILFYMVLIQAGVHLRIYRYD